ncbi:MAG TPA: dihydrodipicolinate synthase family protein [Casimicrobiaceae bacterium]|nr:dihydrodipicolinate synthase family protein [Casimicrobiaceae bacterium]
MKDPTFRGVYPALTTPFRPDLSLDVEGVAGLCDAVIGDGVHGIVVNGCTGESWALSGDERRTVFATAVKTSGGRVRVVAGASAQSAAEALVKIGQAADAGCDCVMVSPPWYVMPGPEEILEHYRKILAGSPLPVLLYNIPRRTGVSLDVATVDRLADDPKVIGIKESSKDWGLLSSIIRTTRDRISVFAGYASFFGLAALCEGAVGYIDSGTPVFGAKSLAFYRAATTGDLDTARGLQADMERMLAAYFGLGTFPASIKAALGLLGRPGGPTRDPIRPLDDAQRQTLRKLMVAAGLLDPPLRARVA